VAIIRKMVRDLNFDVNIVVCPIVRESDGLAMSSRNVYLNAEQRKQATVLHRALKCVRALIEQSESQAEKLITIGKQTIGEEAGVRLDYFEIVDPDTLDPVSNVRNKALIAVAAYVGSTRLIDNVLLPRK
jgi:pantoate--beta-alanine ligase